MRILVVGSGGREHALAWRLAQEPGVEHVVCAPGNDGIAAAARCVPVDVAQPHAILALAAAERIDLTVVGPEAPLAAGVADLFASCGRALFGPSAAAAQLETSKAFAKTVMERHQVPTARHRVCESRDEARHVLRSGTLGQAVVVKADGLAAGKGVVVAENSEQADHAIDEMMTARRFGPAGARVVLEERLTGPEVSYFAVCDGQRWIRWGTAQDHKRAFDADGGPNTGGMGAFAPSPLVDRPLADIIDRTIVGPVLRGLANEGMPFRGFLYCGLMLTADGPKVIEFNVRLGDPEAQVLLPGLAEPIAPILWAATQGTLSERSARLTADAVAGIVMAAHGYPAQIRTGDRIDGLERVARECPELLVFHAGVSRRGGALMTAGGRVLTVVGRGSTLEDAAARAYDGVSRVHFAGMHYRRDIGRRSGGSEDRPLMEPSTPRR